ARRAGSHAAAGGAGRWRGATGNAPGRSRAAVDAGARRRTWRRVRGWARGRRRHPGPGGAAAADGRYAMTDEPCRVLIVDDHPIFREGLRGTLSTAEDLEVIADCEDGREAVVTAERLQPDLVLMDLHLPELSGVA